MPFDDVRLRELFAAPGTPPGSCPRVETSTCAMRCSAPGGAVSRDSALAVDVSITALAVATATTPTRRQILIAPPLPEPIVAHIVNPKCGVAERRPAAR